MYTESYVYCGVLYNVYVYKSKVYTKEILSKGYTTHYISFQKFSIIKKLYRFNINFSQLSYKFVLRESASPLSSIQTIKSSIQTSETVSYDL